MFNPTIDGIADIAKAYMIENGEHPPLLWAVRMDGQIAHASIMLSDKSWMRRHQLREMGKELKKEFGEVVRAYFISEAWGANVDPGEEIKSPVSEHPNRRELLFVVGGEAHEVEFRVFETIRDKKGKVIEMRKDDADIEAIESSLLNAFWEGHTS